MKALLILLPALLLSSCVHTAIAPVSNPSGVPVVIRVPGARPGQTVKAERIVAIDNKIAAGIGVGSGQPTPAPAKADPSIIAIGTVYSYGEMVTKQGERFIGYAPMIVIRSTAPAEMVDRAAGQIAAGYYRSAKKNHQVIPLSDLKTKPKPAKP